MSNCSATRHSDKVTSLLYKKLMEVFRNEEKANRFFNTTNYNLDNDSSLFFKESFYQIDENGDIINPELDRVYHETLEPRIFTEKTSLGYTEHYYLDKDYNKEYVTPRRFDLLKNNEKTSIIESIKESISYFIYNNHKKDNGSDIISILNNVVIKDEIESYLDVKWTEYEKFLEEYVNNDDMSEFRETEEYMDMALFYLNLAESLETVEVHQEDFEKDVLDKFKSFHINVREVDVKEDNKKIDSENKSRDEKVTAIEVSPNDKMSSSVKALISFLPKYDVDAYTGSNSLSQNGVTGDPFFISFNEVNNALRVLFSGIHSMPNEPNIFKAQMKLLKKESVIHPHYNDLISLLEDSSDYIKKQFAQAFNLTKNDILNIEVGEKSFTDSSGDTYKKTVSKLMDASKEGSETGAILKNWRANVAAKTQIKNEKGEYIGINKDVINKAIKALKKTDDIHSSRFKGNVKNDIDKYNKALNDLVFNDKFSLMNIFKALGLSDLSRNTLMIYISPDNFDINNRESRGQILGNISKLLTTIDYSLTDSLEIENVNDPNYNIVKSKESSLFNRLANIQARMNPNVQEAMAFVNSKPVYKYSNASYIQKEVDNIKRNPEYLKESIDSIYTEDSVFKKHLLAENEGLTESSHEFEVSKRVSKFGVKRFGSIQAPKKSSQGSDSKSVTETDSIIESMNGVMRASYTNEYGQTTRNFPAIYNTLASADKSTIFKISIDYFIRDTLRHNEGGKTKFDDKVLDIFYSYFLTEYKRSLNDLNEFVLPYEKALKNLDKNNEESVRELEDTKNKMSIYKHFKIGKNGKIITRENGKLIGNAFKINLIPSLSSEEYNDESLILYNEDGSPAFTDTFLINNKYELFSEDNRDLIKSSINKHLVNTLSYSLNTLKENGIIKPQGDGFFKLNGIDDKMVQSYNNFSHENYGLLNRHEMLNFISDYVINSEIANVEFTKMFTGDPANYKNMTDFFKRVPSTYSDGLHLILDEGELNYNMSVVSNTVVNSLSEGGSFNKMIKDLLESDYENVDLINEVLKPYENVNVTDAQGYITLERWKFLLDRLGMWTSDHDVVYDYLNSTDNDVVKPTGKQLKMAAQPLKGVYYSLKNGHPLYVKYSQAVLSPRLVEGTPMKEFLRQMKEQDIDEAVTLDGVKVGSLTPTDISDINNISFNKQTLNNSDWKLQMELPTKLVKDTLLGSQPQKNIYDGINSDELYKVGEGFMSGEELIDHINDIISGISNIGMDKIVEILGYNQDNGKIDTDKFYELLIDDFKSNPEQFSENIKRAADKRISTELISPLKDKSYSILFSKFKKNLSNIYTSGGSFVQMSNKSISKEDIKNNKGIKMLVDVNELQPPKVVENPNYTKDNLESKFIIEPGQIFISHDKLVSLIPGYEKMSIDEINSKIDERLLRAIGYRIPNQSLASNDALQIVGILPEGHSDTVIAYSEITTKTGSDFDIDKMYIMLPEYSIRYNEKTYKKAKEFIKNATEGLNLKSRVEFYSDIISSFDLDINIDELNSILSSQEEGDQSEEHRFLLNTILDNLITDSQNPLSLKFQEEYEIDSIESIEYVETGLDSKKSLNNSLFESYWSVLTHEKNYSKIMRSIDDPFLENHIKAIQREEVKTSGLLMNPFYQMKMKRMLMETKGGVGVAANHSVDHNISKNKVNYKFSGYSLGVGFENERGETLLDNDSEGNTNSTELTKEELSATVKLMNEKGFKTSSNAVKSFKISDSITALMNAFVDAAKDPFINTGNYNSYTTDTAFLLIRAGVHPYYVNSFLNSGILKDLVSFIKKKESKLLPYNEEYAGLSSFDAFMVDYLKNNGYSKKEAILNIDKLLKSNSSALSYLDLLNNDNSDFNLNINILSKFKEYQEKAMQLNKAISTSRVDVKGVGKSNFELAILTNRLIDLANMHNKEGYLTNHFNKYIRDGKLTSLGTQLSNNVFSLTDILSSNPNIFVSGSTSFMDYIRLIAKVTPNTASYEMVGNNMNEDLLKTVNKEMYTYFLSKFPLFNSNENKLAFIYKVKKEIKDFQSKEEAGLENFFLKSLMFNEGSFGLQFGNITVSDKNKLANSFADLYDFEYKKDEEGNVIPGQTNTYKLAIDLIKASFYMNGGNRTIIDFIEFIPNEFYLNKHQFKTDSGIKYRLSFRDFFNKEVNKMESDFQSYFDSFYERMLQNNLDNKRLVKEVEKEDFIKFFNSSFKGRNVYDSKRNFLTITKKDFEENYSINIDGIKKPLTYLKYRGKLIKLTHRFTKDGQDKYVFKILNKRGFESKTSNLLIKEYSEENTLIPSNKSKLDDKISHELYIKEVISKQKNFFEFNHDLASLSEFYESKTKKDNFKTLQDVRDFIFDLNINEKENFNEYNEDESLGFDQEEKSKSKSKPEVSELFENNPTLANSVYEAMGLTTINESEITYTDEEGNPCAKMGLTNTTKGTGWEIVKDFKGQPKHSQGGVDISISDKGVSMRRGGKDIKAAHGLLIPATIMAQNGLVVDGGDDDILPSWDKVKATLNPKNWGVTDYTDKGSFDNAYAAAKKAGEEEFMWNNERKTTKSNMNEDQQMKAYGITDNQRTVNPSIFRKNLSDLNTIDGYNIPLMNVVDKSLNKNKGEDFSNEPNSPAAKEQDALRLYLGLPQKANTFKPSKYKTGAFELNNYLEKLPDIMPNDEEINYYGKPLSQKEFHKNKGSKGINVADNYSGNTLKPLEDFVMGKHTVKKGKDEKGEYIEYIDEFDFDTYKYNLLNGKIPFTDKTFNLDIPLGDISDKINKPYSIYGRKYYKDYGDGQKRTMYYSDKELSELDVNKKNFDTLALQRELSNRGVKLPKSTTKEGTFDGIWGEETKQALLDYQSKNKKK